MASRLTIGPRKPEFVLDTFYTSEQAKRRLGAIARAVDEGDETIGIMGVKELPLLWLQGIDVYNGPVHRTMTIDELRADWPNATLGCALFGTTIRIEGKKRYRAVLYPNPDAEHGALAYRRATIPDLDALADKLDALVRELRGVASKFDAVNARLEEAGRLAFRALWRAEHGYPVEMPAH